MGQDNLEGTEMHEDLLRGGSVAATLHVVSLVPLTFYDILIPPGTEDAGKLSGWVGFCGP